MFKGGERKKEGTTSVRKRKPLKQSFLFHKRFSQFYHRLPSQNSSQLFSREVGLFLVLADLRWRGLVIWFTAVTLDSSWNGKATKLSRILHQGQTILDMSDFLRNWSRFSSNFYQGTGRKTLPSLVRNLAEKMSKQGHTAENITFWWREGMIHQSVQHPGSLWKLCIK